MQDDFFYNELVERFEEMLEEQANYFFDAEELVEIISYYLDVGDFPFSLKAIEYGMMLYPEDYNFKLKLLDYSIEIESLKQASILIEELKPLAEEDFDFILVQARFWSLKNQHRLAIKFYKKALHFDTELDYIHHCLATEYNQINEVGQAIYHFKCALEIDLDDELTFHLCVDCFDDIHRHKDCIDFILQFIELRPYAEYAWVQLGLQNLNLKNYQKALEAFDYAIAINPKSISSLMQLAYCYEKLEDYSSAIETYQEALVGDDSAAFTYIKIGKCYLKLNQKYKALKAFHQSIHEDPQMDKAWSETANLYETLGNYDEALHYLRRALELDSSNTSYWKRLSFLNIQAGLYEEAEANYHKIISLEPGNFLNWVGFSELLIILGEYQKSIEIAERGLKTFYRAELLYQMSCCYFFLNQKEKAIKCLEKAKKLNNNLLDEMLLKYPIIEFHLNKKKESIN